MAVQYEKSGVEGAGADGRESESRAGVPKAPAPQLTGSNDPAGRADLRENAPDAASPLRGFLALLATLGATALMNGSLFPQFDAIFMFARDISVTFSAGTLLGLGLAAYRAPRLLQERAVIAVAIACLLGGGALLGLGLWLSLPAPLVVGASLASIGRAVATVSAALYLARLAPRETAMVIAVSYTVQLTAIPVTPFLPPWLGAALFLSFPLAAIALTTRGARFYFDMAHDRPAPSDIAITRPASFLAPFSALFVCLFLFQVAFGFALRFGEVSGVPRASLFSAVPAACVALYVVLSRRRFPADGLVQLSALAVMAGFLLAAQPLLVADGGAADVALLNAGNGLFIMAAQMALVTIAARNPLGAVTTVAWGNGVSALGSLSGAAAGMLANGAAASVPALRVAIPAALLLVFAAYVTIGLKRFTFAGAIDGIDPVSVEAPGGHASASAMTAAQTPEEAFAARCKAVAAEYALTPREAEVFAMLARGRDRSYIEEALVVSRNTVKAHVKHIYAKLDIHSHQELIDLVEG
ncbi:helix-turn-helix transcriptional regulator [Eggerthellaceae bacterium 24-137]